MSVTSTACRVSHAADGVATAFAYGFKVLDARHLRVTLRDDSSGTETPLTLNSHFTVTGVGSDAGGTVLLPAPPPPGRSVVVVRDMPATDIAFPAAAAEMAMDKLVLVTQQLQQRTGRALRFPDGDNPSLATTLPSSVERAGKALAFDANGNVALASLDAAIFDAGGMKWAEVRDTPTTLAGYGITDAAPESHVFSGGGAHMLASTLAAGFMSAADKAKLDGLTAGEGAVFSVRDYGAVADGSANAAPGFAAAITAAQAAGGGVVHVPEGTYRLDSTVAIAAAFGDSAGIQLRGDGTNSVLQAGGAIGTVLNVTGDLLSVRDLTIDGAGQGVTGLRHATLNGNDFCRIEGVRFLSCATAFLNDGGDAFSVESCFFNGNAANVVSVNNGMNSRITGCYMLGGKGILFTYPGGSGANGNKQAEGVRITDNTILPGASNYGVRFEGGMQLAVLGNVIDQYGTYGLYLDAADGTAGTRPIRFVTVQGNWFGGAEAAGGTIGLGTGSAGVIMDLQVVGNTFATNHAYGVDLKSNCSEVSLVSNSFHDNGASGGADLSLNGTKRTTAIGNRFRSSGGAYSSIEHTSGTVSLFIGNTFAVGRPVTRSTASRYEGNFDDGNGTLADSGTPTAAAASPTPRGCLLTRTSNTTIGSSTAYDVQWDSAVWDTESCFSTSAATQLKVPSWARFARISAQVTFSSASAAGDRTITIRRITGGNTTTGSTYYGRGFSDSIGNAPYMNHIPATTTAWIPVVAGDYFEVRVSQTSGGNLDVLGTYTTWAQAEFA